MAGETAKTEAICLSIRPWSRTSHMVGWLTPQGLLTTSVKGAVRPKSLFLGQYDLNYTCEIVYYVRGHGDVHALRECVPMDFRASLRSDFRALSQAEYCRLVAAKLSPQGRESFGWYRLLVDSLDALSAQGASLGRLLDFELKVLRLAGLEPDWSGFDPQASWSSFSIERGSFAAGGRQLRLSAETVRCLRNPLAEENPAVLLDAARLIGVFYTFHLDCAVEARRAVLRMISTTKQGN